MSPLRAVLILSLLLGIQPVTTDLYLPALPAIATAFTVSVGETQTTLSALLLAFGASQLIWGAVSDRFGRRPVLLVGLGGYVLAAVACALAPSMPVLILARILQGIALGASVMCARAIVRDLYEPVAGARTLSQALSGLGVLACLSAPLGALIVEGFGWRAALGTTAVFGAATWWAVWRGFDESLTERDPLALAPRRLLSTWRGILAHPVFWRFSLLGAASFAGLFVLLAASSFIFMQVLGLSRPAYGLLLLLNSLAYITGTLLCRRLLRRRSVETTVAIAGGVSLTGGLGLAALGELGVTSVAGLMVPICLYAVAHGLNQPCSQSGAVAPFPRSAGVASALSGFVMMLAAFAAGGWLATQMDGSVLPLTRGMAVCSMLVATAAWLRLPATRAPTGPLRGVPADHSPSTTEESP
ncbi:multidrug effflux MFS transporter [Denitromonas iodatirespirans]|uniref:Multidrug effflux MFS transporter n=1 Tax=Denitromonas iodatirespirans TaxID=2795389 RepID=A0A944DAH4_DENI1|nr:multidrug effflux MFS transporter [Denitromonas iodatirespirans]MBT0962969.1 multidrug effflux MFS transporter [Denitromonas iodatirespirans]